MAEAPKVGSSVLVGAMAFIAAAGWMVSEVISETSSGPVFVEQRAAPPARPMTAVSDSPSTNEAVAPQSEAVPVPAIERLDPPSPPAAREPRPLRSPPPAPARKVSAKASAPAAKRSVQRTVATPRSPIVSTSQAARSPIVNTSQAARSPMVSTSRAAILIEERRRSRDELIELEVMERLASNPRLSGKIGVEAKDSVVRLTGWTRTVGQARRAERDARSVRSVKQVRNEIRPRVGGTV